MTEKTLAVMDFETDPFSRGNGPVKPFAWGLYNGEIYKSYWGEDAADNFVDYILSCDSDMLIYAHNGGRFDFIFLVKYMLDSSPKIINGRIVKFNIGAHELRDSYAILPVPLKYSGQKLDIDYNKMSSDVRWRHKNEIMSYLKQDCIALYEMVSAFRNNLGKGLTMAGTASRLMKNLTPITIDKLTLEQDAELRPYFFGGRVECFEKGIIKERLELRDVRSMYPSVMASELHPVGDRYSTGHEIDYQTDFAEIDATSCGAFPLRTRDGLQFPKARGIYKVTGHELRAALENNSVIIHRVINAIKFYKKSTFADFVDAYTMLRNVAALEGDEIGKLHYKLVLNSSYGRLCLNVDNLFDWYISQKGESAPPSHGPDDWEPAYISNTATFWKKPINNKTKLQAISNVATGASITGAARAVLFRAIIQAERPIYCDTDSLISRSANTKPDEGLLGQWQLEANGDRAAIAAKKLYCMFGDASSNAKENEKRLKAYGDINCVKLASKGVRLKASEIVRVCDGETIVWYSSSPTMSLDGSQNYMSRRVRMT